MSKWFIILSKNVDIKVSSITSFSKFKILTQINLQTNQNHQNTSLWPYSTFICSLGPMDHRTCRKIHKIKGASHRQATGATTESSPKSNKLLSHLAEGIGLSSFQKLCPSLYKWNALPLLAHLRGNWMIKIWKFERRRV